MKKALIVTAHVEHLEHIDLDFAGFDAVICADGGLLIAGKLGLYPTHLIGDYDSVEMPDAPGIIRLPMEKDMTDTEAAVDMAVGLGFDHITVLGGLGGRFDHTMGNLGVMAKYCGKMNHLAFVDGQNYVRMVCAGRYEIAKNPYKYLGVISYGDFAENVTLRGVKYPLEDHFLTHETSLGVSNEITADAAEISFSSGKLLVILSKDIDK
ncbi:MAG: thiamine diphosphokinase [Firmicutes bacterium]|nr:thiamine diphosphokinase [Bacillota bacterium]